MSSTQERNGAVPVAMSTGSVYPESLANGFEIAARLGYDGVEVMVGVDPISQDLGSIKRLSDHYAMPVLAVHAPCLLLTQRVWGSEPWAKLQRAQRVAESVGAPTVVVHPPFRWQRDYARDFSTGLTRMESETDVVFAVENMFPLRAGGREVVPYAPDWSPVEHDFAHVTLDLSHTAVSRSDALQVADVLGDRLAHVHIADGSGTGKDEHLVPGRGGQRCAELLERLGRDAYGGVVVVEVNTRGLTRQERERDLAEALAFTRRHLSGMPAVRSA